MFKGNTWLTMLWGYLLFSAIPPVDNSLKPVAYQLRNGVGNIVRNAFSTISSQPQYYPAVFPQTSEKSKNFGSTVNEKKAKKLELNQGGKQI